MLVCKFGGSSLADADCFARVKDIVMSDRRRRVIVVSAPGRRGRDDRKVTDLLLDAAAGPADIARRALTRVRERFAEISDVLGLKSADSDIDGLEKRVPGNTAFIASRGEMICARMLAEYLDMPFIDAADVFAFSGGEPDEKATYENIRRLASGGGVIPGFYGRDEHGKIAVFPRGGSDICGAYAAAALNAEGYENWTDVDGIYTLDPVYIGIGEVIPAMSYKQARLITSLGAGVLHSESIYPAERAGVPIYVKNTFNPISCGTRISDGDSFSQPCAAVRFSGGNAVISVTGYDERICELMRACVRGQWRFSLSEQAAAIICPIDDVNRAGAMVGGIIAHRFAYR